MTGPNRLAQETSPYLRQHQDNPVDWYPWGPEAFARAADEEKPILLSIGYSACHWCHVMAHESFEDPAVAAVMNQGFVCIKVDREERPDVDAVYMEAVQAATGRGGWPMTVFLTPGGHPFMAGTYFPPVDRHGMPAFVRVLDAVSQAWLHKRVEVMASAQEMSDAIEARTRIPLGSAAASGSIDAESGLLSRLDRSVLDRAIRSLAESFDPAWGGFGPAPKFPQPAMIDLALRAWSANHSPATLAMATTTLGAMAAGGIRDHLGGGFARYSTDARWLVPHFEKMLYDQAGLLRVYIHAWQATGEPEWLDIATEIVSYVQSDLRHPDGGLYSAEDADSEGEEGRFYLWSPDEVEKVLGPERAKAAMEFWGVTPEGNFEGANILTRPMGQALRPPDEATEADRQALFQARKKRLRPGLDDKVLTEWNAMFASSLAEAAAATGRHDWADAAEEVGRFLLAHLRRPDGRWLRSWQDGRARHLAYAADYAWLVDAFTRLGELTGRAVWTEEARVVADAMLALFSHGNQTGLWTTGADAEALIVATRDIYDGATPSANGVAVVALLRLGVLVGDQRYSDAALAILDMLAEPIAAQPTAFAHALAGLDLALSGPIEVVITGDRPDLVATAQQRYLPRRVLAWGEAFDSPLWQGRGDNLAFVCEGYACGAPVSGPAELDRLLNDA